MWDQGHCDADVLHHYGGLACVCVYGGARMEDMERAAQLYALTKQPFRQAMMNVYEVDREEEVEHT